MKKTLLCCDDRDFVLLVNLQKDLILNKEQILEICMNHYECSEDEAIKIVDKLVEEKYIAVTSRGGYIEYFNWLYCVSRLIMSRIYSETYNKNFNVSVFDLIGEVCANDNNIFSKEIDGVDCTNLLRMFPKNIISVSRYGTINHLFGHKTKAVKYKKEFNSRFIKSRITENLNRLEKQYKGFTLKDIREILGGYDNNDVNKRRAVKKAIKSLREQGVIYKVGNRMFTGKTWIDFLEVNVITFIVSNPGVAKNKIIENFKILGKRMDGVEFFGTVIDKIISSGEIKKVNNCYYEKDYEVIESELVVEKRPKTKVKEFKIEDDFVMDIIRNAGAVGIKKMELTSSIPGLSKNNHKNMALFNKSLENLLSSEKIVKIGCSFFDNEIIKNDFKDKIISHLNNPVQGDEEFFENNPRLRKFNKNGELYFNEIVVNNIDDVRNCVLNFIKLKQDGVTEDVILDRFYIIKKIKKNGMSIVRCLINDLIDYVEIKQVGKKYFVAEADI